MTRQFNHDDRIATIAACSTMGLPVRSGFEPLGPDGWSRVAHWLSEGSRLPRHLLDPELDFAGLDPKLANRLSDLPARASLVALELERFESRGIWSLVRFDDGYPRRWRDRLKSLSPPVLFGAGPVELLCQTPSVAIVGSRNIDEDLAEIARTLGRRASSGGYLVVSGGARGSDRHGMFGALGAGHRAVGILHGDLLKDAGKQDTRQWIEDGLLTLAAHVHPATGFVTGNAMARNRYIHALADASVVISTAAGSGGTWAGSVDNLKNRWSPLLVWNGDNAPAGNSALIAEGGYGFASIPADPAELTELIAAASTHQAEAQSARRGPIQTGLPL